MELVEASLRKKFVTESGDVFGAKGMGNGRRKKTLCIDAEKTGRVKGKEIGWSGTGNTE